MIDHTDTQQPAPSQEHLVLPAVPPGQQQQQPSWGYTNPRVQISPAMLIRHNTPPPPRSLFAKMVYFWRKDPAYKVLMIAVAMVVIAGLLLTTLATTSMLHSFDGLASGRTGVQSPVGTTQPVATVDNKPTFPTPGGGQGSTVTSQPPMQSTPDLQPSPTSQPTTPPQGGLSVQITSIPNRVRNNTAVDVGVTTNGANLQVSLQIIYSVLPYRSFAGPVATDNNGNASIRWTVTVYGFSNRTVTATVYAVVRDQNGQTVRSQPASVSVIVQGGGL
jgi:hypothetical protein